MTKNTWYTTDKVFLHLTLTNICIARSYIWCRIVSQEHAAAGITTEHQPCPLWVCVVPSLSCRWQTHHSSRRSADLIWERLRQRTPRGTTAWNWIPVALDVWNWICIVHCGCSSNKKYKYYYHHSAFFLFSLGLVAGWTYNTESRIHRHIRLILFYNNIQEWPVDCATFYLVWKVSSLKGEPDVEPSRAYTAWCGSICTYLIGTNVLLVAGNLHKGKNKQHKEALRQLN